MRICLYVTNFNTKANFIENKKEPNDAFFA